MAGPFGNIINGIFGPPIAVQSLDAQDRIKREQAAREGGAQAAILRRINEIRAQNPNMQPNQLIQAITSDPAFIDTISTGNAGDFQKTVNDMVTAITQPFGMTKVGAGDNLVTFGNDGKPNVVFSAPFAPKGDGSSENERAASRLMSQGLIDQGTADKIIMGAIKVQPGLNQWNQPNGEMYLVDLASGQVRKLDPGGSRREPPNVGGQGAPPPADGTGTGMTTPAQTGQQYGGPGQPSSFAQDPQRWRMAISGIESGGSKNPYGLVGPVTKGDRAYGRYQVMGANIPQWTKQATGIAMTPREFLASPEAQDAVFDFKFGQYVRQTGNPADAAAMWFSGRPLSSKNANTKDVLGTSVAGYVQKFMANMGDFSQQPDAARGGPTIGNAAENSSVTVQPAQTTAQPAPTGTGTTSPGPTPVAEAALETGAVPALSNLFSNIAGQIDPKLIDEENTRSRARLKIFNESVVDWGQKTNRPAYAEQERVRKAFGMDEGLFTNPVANVIKLQEFRREVQSQYNNDVAVANDGSQPLAERAKAFERLNAGKRMLASIGSEADLDRALQTARTIDARKGAKGLVERGKKAAGEVKDAVTNTPEGGVLTDAEFNDTVSNADSLAAKGDLASRLRRMSPDQYDAFKRSRGGQ